MGEAGVFLPEDRVELIEGVIVRMSPIGVAHRFAVDQLNDILPTIVKPNWYVSVQNPVSMKRSEPQPDIAVVRGTTRDYVNRHPGAADVGLLIEVADSTLDYDRRAKGFTYSRYNVPLYWIVNLVDKCVEVYGRAQNQSVFSLMEVHDRSSTVPVMLDGNRLGEIKVADLLTDTV